MPQNPSTGKMDRRALSQAEILEFRLKQTEELLTAAKGGRVGRRCVRDLPEAGRSEGSGLSPSPLATLSGLGGLTLDSGGSSTADTPADSPAALLPQATLPERPAAAPPSAPKTRGGSKHLGKSSSMLLIAAPLSIQQVSRLRRQAPRVLAVTHCQGAMMEAMLPGFPGWRVGWTLLKNGPRNLREG